MSPWQHELKQAIRTTTDLLTAVELTQGDLQSPALLNPDFPLFVPLPFVDKIQKGDPNDPLLKQVLPLQSEQSVQPGYVCDPLQEQRQSPAPGLIHKYFGRVLWLVSQSCAIQCRYCFRKHFPYAEYVQSRANWQHTLSYIREEQSISEVILSGGDPLILKDELLADLIQQLELIPHVETLRIHTRLPIAIPERITAELGQILSSSRLRVVVVVHCNHPNELDDKLKKKLEFLKSLQVTLLNQTVLLKGINDDPQVLSALSQQLFKAHILPYYIHLLDKTLGTHPFEVTYACMKEIQEKLLSSLPGYLVPKFVQEIPDLPYKALV